MKHRIRFWWPLAALAFAALFGFAVMLLWNWVLPVVTGLPEITFWQALGLLALSRILFGGFGLDGRVFAVGAMRGRDREHGNPFREGWFKMSDEERKEFLRKHSPFNAHMNAHIFGEYGVDEPESNKDKE
jgi:hypothetical protein